MQNTNLTPETELSILNLAQMSTSSYKGKGRPSAIGLLLGREYRGRSMMPVSRQVIGRRLSLLSRAHGNLKSHGITEAHTGVAVGAAAPRAKTQNFEAQFREVSRKCTTAGQCGRCEWLI